MAFATNDDIVDIRPGIFDHGVEDWTVELNKAEADIILKIRADWFNKRYSRDDWDATLLTNTQWTTATIYRALAYYILPKLTQWRVDSDAFQEQIEFYQARYAEEMGAQFDFGIEYDYNEDTVVTDNEVNAMGQNRIWR